MIKDYIKKKEQLFDEKFPSNIKFQYTTIPEVKSFLSSSLTEYNEMVVKIIDGHKEVYTDLERQGKEKEHEDSSHNELLDDILSIINEKK